MKLVSKQDLINIGIDPLKILTIDYPVALLNDMPCIAKSYSVDKLEDLFKLDWISDIHNGGAGYIFMYDSPSFNERQKLLDESMKIITTDNYVLRVFSNNKKE
jgi:hypothetical protein